MSQVFAAILAHEPEIKRHFNFVSKDYTQFEKEYEVLLQKLDDINPASDENTVKCKELKSSFDDIVKKWGVGPVILYNEYKFKNHDELGTYEKRLPYYKSYDEMIKGCQAILDDPVNFLPKGAFTTGRTEFEHDDYSNWTRHASNKMLKNLTPEQCSALYAVKIFIDSRVRYEMNAPYHDMLMISDERKEINDQKYQEQKNKANKKVKKQPLYMEGDCDTMTALYVTCLSALTYEEKGNARASVFQSSQINVEELPLNSHTRLSVSGVSFESTRGNFVDPKNDEYGSAMKFKGGAGFMIGFMIFSGDRDDKIKNDKSFDETRLLAAKLAYILKENSANEEMKGHLIQAYKTVIGNASNDMKYSVAYKLALEFGNKDIIDMTRKEWRNEARVLLTNGGHTRSDPEYTEKCYYEAYKIARQIDDPSLMKYVKGYITYEKDFQKCEAKYAMELASGHIPVPDGDRLLEKDTAVDIRNPRIPSRRLL